MALILCPETGYSDWSYLVFLSPSGQILRYRSTVKLTDLTSGSARHSRTSRSSQCRIESDNHGNLEIHK